MGRIDVFAADEQSAEPVDSARWVRLAREVLVAQGVRADTEVSLLFVDEEAMAELNKRFLDKEGPTDVLAFPIDDDDLYEGARSSDPPGPHAYTGGPGAPGTPFLTSTGPTAGGPADMSRRDDRDDFDDDFDEVDDAPALLGDVVVCPAVARRNAPGHAGTYDDEIALLVVHGLLHLLGMDHLDAAEAEAMERREQELLVRFHRQPQTAPAGQ